MSFIKKFIAKPSSRQFTTLERRAGGETVPFYFRATVVLIGISVFFYCMQLLRDVLIPVAFATLIAILLNPIVNRLMKWKIPKVLAIILALLLTVLIFAVIILFISSQVAQFTELAPQLKTKSTEILQIIQQWLKQTFNWPISKQDAALKNAMNSSQEFIGQTIGGLFGIIGVMVLLPIYTFLILYYKPLFLNFFYEVFDDKHEKKVADVLSETKGAVQSYIVGLLTETLIVASLNSIALLIIGVKYAILLGVIGGLLNMIPYIGGLIAIALPVAMAILTGHSYTTALIIIAAYTVIQFVDNNLIVPNIVASKVDVNAFVAIIIVILGGTLWGVAGMFLSVPFAAVCKIIFDRIPDLKPWGKVLGTELGEPPPPREIVSKIDEEAME